METNIEKLWKKELVDEFTKDYFIELSNFIHNEYLTKKVYPDQNNIFRAFEFFPPSKTKVVIIGQDPYHEPGQAHGLCFSVCPGTQNPPSLKNIIKEIKSDLGLTMSNTGDLTPWAKQGVLLLNATLTVLDGQAGSHQHHGWERFTDTIIRLLSDKQENLVFLLWGAYAQSKKQIINSKKHLILTAPHPSPLSAYRGFFECKHFSKTNIYLLKNGKQKINWLL